jgi:hypothetical protein
MADFGVPGLHEFLRDYPLMAIRPSTGKGLQLRGEFSFRAKSKDNEEVSDSFNLTISVPEGFPKIVPRVKENGGRIPRHVDFHINPDGTLCLGSPLRLLMQLSAKATLTGFAEVCLVPYLFAISLKLKDGRRMAFDELPHGTPGMLADYADLFGLGHPAQIRKTLSLLGMKRRIANKRPCPCECGRRLGKCRFNIKVIQIRRLSYRSWFKHQTLIDLNSS